MKEFRKDMKIKDIVKLLNDLDTDDIIVEDLDANLWTENLSVRIEDNGRIALILPFSTKGLHEWREDIADEMYN
jgi:hypothetical protein